MIARVAEFYDRPVVKSAAVVPWDHRSQLAALVTTLALLPEGTWV